MALIMYAGLFILALNGLVLVAQRHNRLQRDRQIADQMQIWRVATDRSRRSKL